MRMLILATLMLISDTALSSEIHLHNNKHHNHNNHTKKVIANTIASWYGYGHKGKITASGSIFDPRKLTCAHKTLKFGTRLRVTNVRNNKSVIVEVNDRGPYIRGRSIDLSMAAAQKIDMGGIGQVRIEKFTSLLVNKY